MAATKWADVAQRAGQQLAAAVREHPAVESLWVSEDDEGIELWLVTAPTEPAVTSRLHAAGGPLYDQFPEAYVRFYVMNRRNFPAVDLDARLTERGQLIERFHSAG
ncbi:MAG TPA: hypothetical protein VII06_36805 [Chloroflexota bacterium]|jgi:hypothetical protein